jgi:hypothetical protein
MFFEKVESLELLQEITNNIKPTKVIVSSVLLFLVDFDRVEFIWERCLIA